MSTSIRNRTGTIALVLGILAILGAIGRSVEAEEASRPNIVLIMADDMGYSDAACFGGEIRTPNLSTLAEGGVRFTQMYSTGRCWPSRACILTGYYAQQIRRDGMPGIARGNRPAWAPLLPAMLEPHGYTSYHSGKWHIDGTPQDGRFARSWGGERSGCDWDRFFDSKPWKEGPFSAPVKPGEDYYSTVAIADHAIQCLKLHQSEHGDKPLFQYVTFYSPHFPLHAMQKDIDSYRGAYRDGWDIVRERRWKRMKEMGLLDTPLSARHPDIVPRWNLKPEQLRQRIGPGEAAHAVAWESLTEKQKTFQADKMAIHAAMITRMDLEIGRIIEQLKAMGVLDNTLLLFVSDNGASAEQIIRGDGHDPNAPRGSADSYLCLGPGWSTAANTPFRLHKHWNHEGGISSPFIAHWPDGIAARGELRHNPAHFIDIVPTILELATDSPEISSDTPLSPARPGHSLLPAFARDGTVEHETLWWCHSGNRAIRMGDWKLSGRAGRQGEWELYNLAVDRCEMNDLRAEHPERVRRMARQWESIAEGFRNDLGAADK